MVRVAATNKYASNKRYKDKAYECYNLSFHKGERDAVKSHAAALGESMNGFIMRAIKETMARDAAHGETAPAPTGDA